MLGNFLKIAYALVNTIIGTLWILRSQSEGNDEWGAYGLILLLLNVIYMKIIRKG